MCECPTLAQRAFARVARAWSIRRSPGFAREEESPLLASALSNGYQLVAAIAFVSVAGTAIAVALVPDTTAHRLGFAAELAVVGVGVVVLALVLDRRTAKVVARPFRALEETLATIAAGNYDVRSDLPLAATEIRAMGALVNGLADEVVRAREAEAEALGRLRSLDEAQHRFLSYVASELRSPLVSMVGQVEFLRATHADALTPEGRNVTSAIQYDGRTILALLEDLLPVVPAEPRRPRLEHALIDLAGVLKRVEHDVGPAAEWLALQLEFSLEEGVRLFGDEQQVERALLNLVSNAVLSSSREVASRCLLARNATRPSSK